jgi:protein phosphatase
VRTENQDALCVDEANRLFIISDGMGGLQAGALASRIATKLLPAMLLKRLASGAAEREGGIPALFQETLRALNGEVLRQTAAMPGVEGLGATVVALLFRGETATIAHLGDSRCYRLRDDNLERLTADHNLTNALAGVEKTDPDDALGDWAKDRLTRFLGMPDEPCADTWQETARKGDRFLLCTDGLSGLVNDRELQAILQANRDVNRACQALVSAALNRGGRDNISVLVVDVEHL